MLLRALQHPALSSVRGTHTWGTPYPGWLSILSSVQVRSSQHSSTLEQLIFFRFSMQFFLLLLLLLLLLYHHLGLQPPRRQGLKIDSHARATELFITGINN